MKRSYIKKGTSQLKRSGFKNKPKTALKRTKLRKVSKAPLALIQRKIWAIIRLRIREKYGNTCYTCLRTGLEKSNWHTGHMWAKASLGAFLKYDERVLRPQCYDCNINKGGMGADFYTHMLHDIGGIKMAKLEKDRNVIVNARDHYEKLLAELEK